MLDVERIRKDFPILTQQVYGKPLIYVDNAASTQKPRQVIETLTAFYEHDNANIHRGVHQLSQRATTRYEKARQTVQNFLGAGSEKEIVFVRGATEGVNLVASSFLAPLLKAGDDIIISEMEHHSNIIPWQLLADQCGANLVVLPLEQDGTLNFGKLDDLLSPRVKLLAITQMSNSLGTINDLKPVIQKAHAHGVPVLVDGAQSVAHFQVDVTDLDCDFFVFSGHKIYGPTGIGVLYAKADHLRSMRPYQGGGDMILSVSFEHTEFNEIPYKFEAGTPDIAGAIGLAAALDYVSAIGLEAIDHYERDLLHYATEKLQGIQGLRIIGTAEAKGSIISFTLEGIHPHDVGTIMDMEGVAVRTGHHCTQPVMDCFNIPATTRVSLSFYNTHAEIDGIVTAIQRVKELMG